MSNKRFIFPMKVMTWGTLQTDSGEKLKPSEKMKAVGYIPVYESISEMVDDHGTDVQSGTFMEDANHNGRHPE